MTGGRIIPYAPGVNLIPIICNFIARHLAGELRNREMVALGWVGDLLIRRRGAVDKALDRITQRGDLLLALHGFVELRVAIIIGGRLRVHTLPAVKPFATVCVPPSSLLAIVFNLLIGTVEVDVVDLISRQLTRIHRLICIRIFFHRAGHIEHEHDVERLAGGRSQIGIRRECRKGDDKIVIAFHHGSTRAASGELQIVVVHGLVGPNAANVVGRHRAGFFDPFPPIGYGRGIDLGIGGDCRRRLSVCRRSPRRGLDINRSCLRGRNHRRQCKRCAQHGRGQHPGQAPYR